MKKLLFLLGCGLLLLGAAAAPASATDDIEWQVVVDWTGGGQPFIVEVNYTDLSWTDLKANGDPLTAVPDDAKKVSVGMTVAWVTLGNTRVFAKSFFQRMQVWDPSGTKVIDVDETTGQGYWTAPYRYNDWTSPYGPLLPYNPRIGQGMMWATDWLVPLPLPAGSTTYTPGTYTISYSNMLRHTVADPMFPGRVPGGEGYPPIGKPWDWSEPFTSTFVVE